MKTIGTANHGGYIVEMTVEEHRLLARLAKIEDGWTEWDFIPMGDQAKIDYDLSRPFEAVRAYMHGKLPVNQLKRHIDLLDRSLNAEDTDG